LISASIASSLSGGDFMKLRKKTQLTFMNLKGAGRPAINDPGIRHTKRPYIKKPASLHLTIKVKKNKAEIKNKSVLKILKRAIFNSRKQGLKVIHFSLEYDHVHLLIEAENNHTLGKGMQAFGVTLSKAINRLKKLKGGVYKHRYHFRQISSTRDLKRVMNYIFTNGIKHGATKNIVNSYNSIEAEKKYYLFYKGNMTLNSDLISSLDLGRIFYKGLEFI
jgi:REP element-mobilizing transposase RayT